MQAIFLRDMISTILPLLAERDLIIASGPTCQTTICSGICRLSSKSCWHRRQSCDLPIILHKVWTPRKLLNENRKPCSYISSCVLIFVHTGLRGSETRRTEICQCIRVSCRILWFHSHVVTLLIWLRHRTSRRKYFPSLGKVIIWTISNR